jgi:hypothetical protein
MRKFILRAEARAVSGRGAVLHASAVDVRGRALVLLARSGGGKSTTASLLESWGHERLADDSLLVSRGTDGIWRVLPCASWTWSIGRETAARPLGWIAFLEKGSPAGLWSLDPAYSVWRALAQRQLMAYLDLPAGERTPLRSQTRVMFAEIPSFLLLSDLGEGLRRLVDALR